MWTFADKSAIISTARTHLGPRSGVASALSLLAVAWACFASASALPAARVARTLNVTDEAHLHLTGTQGEVLLEEGAASGAMPGIVKVRFTVSASVSGSFTIYPRGGGSISGHGAARLHSTNTYSSFGGSMYINHGTGRYAHARGHGGFYGTVNRHNDALVIQTTGRLTY